MLQVAADDTFFDILGIPGYPAGFLRCYRILTSNYWSRVLPAQRPAPRLFPRAGAAECFYAPISDRVLVRFSFISSNFLAHRVFRSHEVGLLMSMGRSPHTTQRKQALIGIK